MIAVARNRLCHAFIAVALMLVASIPLTLGESAQAATPSAPPTVRSVTISGEGVPSPLTVRSDTDTDLFNALIDQVSWLKGAGHPASPKAGDLGPKYSVVVLVDEVAKQTYDLYPLATGGPRAFRPAQQPDQRKTTAAWFFGRLNMSETLRAAGVPLPARHDVISGGLGGGERAVSDGLLDPSEGLDQIAGDLRRLLLLNGAVVLVIALGLAGISLLVRRRTR